MSLGPHTLSKRYLRLLQSAIIAPLLVLVGVFYFHNQSERAHQAFNLSIATEGVAHELKTWLELNTNGLDLTARMIGSESSDPLIALANALISYPAFTSLSVTDTAGRVILESGDLPDAPPLGTYINRDEGFIHAKSTATAHISTVGVDPNDDDKLLLVLTVPITDTQGHFAGALRGSIEIASFSRKIVELSRYKLYQFIISDSAGTIVLASSDLGYEPMDRLPPAHANRPEDSSQFDIQYTATLPDLPLLIKGYVLKAHPISVDSHQWMLAGMLITCGVVAWLFYHLAARAKDTLDAQMAAEAANQSRIRFLAMTSHEIKTPLNAIIGLSDSLSETIKEKSASDQIATIRSAGEFLQHVVADLVDLSSMDANKLEIFLSPVHLPSLCREICTLFSVQASQKHLFLQLVLEIPENLTVSTDGSRLRQVLINLVGNAMKFTRRGSVRLLVESCNESASRIQVRFTVSDTGPGIPDSVISRLFEPYYRGSQTGPGSPEGTGLGLHISRRLVDLLGGQIVLNSIEGRGSDFSFTLDMPRLLDAARLAAASTAPAALSQIRVLAVDDNQINQEVIMALLDGHCARVQIASTASEALDLLRTEAFDVALLDLEMPDGDGFHLLREFDNAPGLSAGCRMIAVSAHAPELMRDRCLLAGFQDYISKPLHKKALHSVIGVTNETSS